MKIKLDENMPSRLVGSLAGMGHDVDTVQQEGISGRTDPVVWEAAQKAGRFLITQDLHFSDLRSLALKRHAGVLLVRLREPGRGALSRRVQSLFETEKVDRFAGQLIILTERKLRIARRHPSTDSR